MGSSLSVCGLGPSADERQQASRPHAFEREKVKELLAHSERARSLSVTTDSSVASILSSSDRLIPDAFRPVDIQVVSQRRVRPASSRFLALTATPSHSGGNGHAPPYKLAPSTTSNHYYTNGAHANTAFLRYLTSSTASESLPPASAATERFASRRKGCVDSSLAFTTDDDGGSVLSASSRRSGNLSGASVKGAA